MSEEVSDQKTVTSLVKGYANRECVGQFGEITHIDEHDTEWQIEFETHTFSDTHTHTVRITKAVGNMVGHKRANQFE